MEIDSYLNIISYCRQAKQFGIEIHKILKVTQTVTILNKYEINLTTMQKYPIYDDRIPEDYKVDAIDNYNLVFLIENERLAQLKKKNLQNKE